MYYSFLEHPPPPHQHIHSGTVEGQHPLEAGQGKMKVSQPLVPRLPWRPARLHLGQAGRVGRLGEGYPYRE